MGLPACAMAILNGSAIFNYAGSYAEFHELCKSDIKIEISVKNNGNMQVLVGKFRLVVEIKKEDGEWYIRIRRLTQPPSRTLDCQDARILEI